MLALMIAFCFGLSIFRVAVTGTGMYLFLVWNLFLAFIPLCFSSLLYRKERVFQRNWFKWLTAAVWLVFFPNAPYILTDLFHLKWHHSMPQWFDLILILSYAWTGLMAGMLSLRDIEKQFVRKLFPKRAVLILGLLLFITAFGIYLGRFLRFNSWDLIQNPDDLFYQIGHRFAFPWKHPRTWGVTLGMGVLLNFMYWGTRLFQGSGSLLTDKHKSRE